ncbi:hypothetical protein, partial [Cylindrospermopsis raciborskii]|uniref:hypothetical protein n=1 Tax=Cylindrospermopsis raciborskii TaxID=77022 RepID=UPI001F0EDE12
PSTPYRRTLLTDFTYSFMLSQSDRKLKIMKGNRRKQILAMTHNTLFTGEILLSNQMSARFLYFSFMLDKSQDFTKIINYFL